MSMLDLQRLQARVGMDEVLSRPCSTLVLLAFPLVLVVTIGVIVLAVLLLMGLPVCLAHLFVGSDILIISRSHNPLVCLNLAEEDVRGLREIFAELDGYVLMR
jgi:hypothetical protein